jgi:hypothetical protein
MPPPAQRTALALQNVVRLEDQPGCADEAVSYRQRNGGKGGEGDLGSAPVQAHDVEPQHEALGECGRQRAGKEGPVPALLVRKRRLGAELEGDPTQDQPDEHDGDGQIERGQDLPMSQGKCHQQDADCKHEPCFVGIPEGPDGRDHAVALGGIREGKQQADPKVETVEHDIEENGEAQQARKDQWQGFGCEHGLTRQD